MIEFEDELPTNPVQVRKGKNADGVTVEMKRASDTEWTPAFCLRRDKTWQPLNISAVGAALGYDNLVDGKIPQIG